VSLASALKCNNSDRYSDSDKSYSVKYSLYAELYAVWLNLSILFLEFAPRG